MSEPTPLDRVLEQLSACDDPLIADWARALLTEGESFSWEGKQEPKSEGAK